MKIKTQFFNTFVLIFLSTLLFTVSSCGDKGDGGGDGGDGDGEVSDETIELTCSDFDEDMTLKNSKAAVDYLIDCKVSLKSDLKIEPGTVIAFTSGSYLYVGEGSLNAVGADENRIIFRGEDEETGEWSGIEIESNSSKNQLAYVTIRHTGDSYISCCDGPFSLSLRDGKVDIRNLIAESSTGNGIFVSEDIRVSGFSDVRVKTHEGYSMWIHPNQTNILNSENIDLSGNDKDLILLNGNKIDEPTTIYAANIPYYIENALNANAALSIEPGTDFKMGPNSSFYVDSKGSIKMDGQDSQPITFSGVNDEKGYWKGIYINSTNSNNSIKHVTISDAGSSYVSCCTPASLFIDGKTSVSNVSITNGLDNGIYLDKKAVLSEFNNISVSSHNKAPLYATLQQLDNMDIASCDFSGNTQDNIFIHRYDLETPAKLKKANVSYVYNENGTNLSIESDFTIQPGVELIFSATSGMSVSKIGSLNAVGTSSENITFRGANDASGYWNGIYLGSNNTNNIINYINIDNAGAGYVVCCDAAGLVIDDNASLKISNSSFTKIKDCAIRYDQSSSSVELNNISYSEVGEETCDI